MAQQPSQLTIIRPDDWHLHVRDGAVLRDVLRDTAQRFARAIIMPNLKQPVITVEQALAYRERILAVLPSDASFEPLMTLYLSNSTQTDEVAKAKASGMIQGIKLYPARATTHSEAGIADLKKAYPIFAEMEKQDMPLLIHGEVTDESVDVFDREQVFIDRHLREIVESFPSLRVVLEHITTKHAVAFVESASQNVAATVTAHHLLLNRNALFFYQGQGGVRPHHYCLPILKREAHREALLKAITSGNPKFFLGTDSAPHAKSAKEAACGCAGIYTAHAALELYAEIFEAAHALEKLEAFASLHGADFYRLPRNTDRITLHKEAWEIPNELKFGGDLLIPFRAGERVAWKLIQ